LGSAAVPAAVRRALASNFFANQNVFKFIWATRIPKTDDKGVGGCARRRAAPPNHFQKSAKDFAMAVVFLYKDGNTTPMKISKHLALGFLVISLTPVFGQPTAAPTAPSTQLYQQRLQEIVGHANGVLLSPTPIDPATGLPVETTLTKFNLDFPGGTPAQLVKAIEKTMNKTLNAIIPDEDSDTQLPPLKMNDVTVPQLFTALEAVSRLTTPATPYVIQFGGATVTQYGFRTTDNSASDDSIWYFYAYPPASPVVSAPKVCKFYPLIEYLNKGLTVDDITTAIQTGWKMAGIASPPELNYHKETKLLIAFGETNELETIDDVLKALEKSDYRFPIDIDPNTGLPVTAEKPNAEKSGK
jgi:hypothetical protein